VNPMLTAAARATKCHEAVMLWVHHLTAEAQQELLGTGLVLPALPEKEYFSETNDAQCEAESLVTKGYKDATTCKACHGDPSSPATTGPPPAPDAPKWPPVMSPIWPSQWTSAIVGWNKNARFPHGLNITGAWHYDYLNNRVRQDFLGHSTGSWLPLKTNTTLFWFGDPRPTGEPPGTNHWQPGVFYVVVRPAPFVEVCSAIAYPGMSIVRPDAFDQVRLFHGLDYVGREHTDGRWADHWSFQFVDSEDHACDGNFTMWVDINDHTPVMDYGPSDCAGGIAASHWSNFSIGQPDPGLWTTQDFSMCKNTTMAAIAAEDPLVMELINTAMRWASPIQPHKAIRNQGHS